MGTNSLSACLVQDASSPLPFPFPANLHVVCLASPEEHGITQTLAMYHRLIEISGAQGSVHIPEQNLTPKAIKKIFKIGFLTHNLYIFRVFQLCSNALQKCNIPPSMALCRVAN